MLKISAIDVRSNAMRMVVGEVDETWHVSSRENVRLPVCLGGDVFAKGTLNPKIPRQIANLVRYHRKRSDVELIHAVAAEIPFMERNV